METLYPTSAGLNYAAQTAAGKVLVFTRGKFGNGVRKTEAISTLSELINPLGEMPISKKSVSDSTVMVTTQFSNQVDGALLDTFYLSEVGLYAKLQSEDGTDDEDYPETLVAYAYDNPGDKIPGTVLTEFIFNFPLTVAEASNVDVEISSMAYTTQEDFDAEVEARAAADEELQASLDAHTAGDSPADDTTSEAAPAHGGTVTMIDGVTRDDAGHVLSVNTKTVTLPSDENTDTKVTQTNTTTNADYRLLLSGSASDTTSTTTSRKSTNFKANPSTGVLTAPTFSGNLTGNVTGNVTGNADTATTATSATSADTAAKLGSDTVGSGTKPIYLSSGAATASSSTVGATNKPIYMSSGTLTASSSTLGSGTKPIYMSSGAITASSSTVGDANTPVYMSSGTITAGNNIKNYATYVVAASDSVGKENADYVCDGSADQSEINSAITAASTNGGKVVLLEGNYSLSSAVKISNDNVTIEGMGNGTVITTTDDIYAFHIYKVSNCKISSLSITTTVESPTTSDNTGIYADYALNCTIRDCTISGTYTGINLDWSSGSNIVDGNYINNISKYGIYIYRQDYDGAGHNKIINNNISGCGYSSIYAISSNYNIITGNTILSLSSHAGVILYNASHLNVSKNTIVMASANYGIYEYASDCNIISGNNILSSLDPLSDRIGIYSGSNCELSNISGNIIYNPLEPIVIYGVNSLAVGNVIYGTYNYGILLTSSSSYNLVTGNRISGTIITDSGSNNTVVNNLTTTE